MRAHTPGPWTFKPVSGTPKQLEEYKKHGLFPVQNCNNQGERYIMHGDPEGSVYGRVALVATQAERKERGKNATPYDAPDAERDANARLIAAAPELLEALRVARAYMSINGEQSRIEVVMVDAAISKALGK